MTSEEDKENIKKLEQFVYDNEKLELLESKVNDFNPFNVLKADSFEIRHSNFLAWILDSHQNHKLGEYVLKKFIKEICIKNIEEKDYNLRRLMTMDLSDVEIFREEKNIDLLIVSDKNKLVILVENKIKSSESKNQLKKYLDYCKEKYSGHIIIPVFLTIEGDEPSEEEYCSLTYENVYAVLKFALEVNKDQLKKEIADFIKHYLRVLEVLLMKDENLKKLCKEIYSEHKDAIDLINEYVGNGYEESMDNFLKNYPELVQVYRAKKHFWFLPKKTMDKLPKNYTQSWNSPYPISIWSYLRDDFAKIGLIVEVGPFKDAKKRVDFLKYLRNNGIDIKESSMDFESRYTRIYSQTIKYEDWEEPEKLSKELIELYKKCQEPVKKIFDLVEKYDFN